MSTNEYIWQLISGHARGDKNLTTDFSQRNRNQHQSVNFQYRKIFKIHLQPDVIWWQGFWREPGSTLENKKLGYCWFKCASPQIPLCYCWLKTKTWSTCINIWRNNAMSIIWVLDLSSKLWVLVMAKDCLDPRLWVSISSLLEFFDTPNANIRSQ
jgi:hypothetical protein